MCICCSCLVCVVVVVLCVLFSSYVYLLYCVCIAVFTLETGLLARSQYSEGPATGHLDTGFSWFRCVYKQMLRWFPRFQVATTYFSCSPYLLSSWCRALLEKLTGSQLVKKFPAFHGIRRFITALTSVHHLSLSWASPIQSIYPHPTSWRSILILSTHLCLGLPSGLFPSSFPT